MRASPKVFIVIIVLVIVCNYTDRYVLAVFLNDIGHDLSLTDAQLGLVGGLPFAVLYALAGIPFARIADVSNRRNLIVAATAAWSVATAFCGLAAGFWSLFLCRLLVGIGEGAGTPPIHSLIADRYGAKRGAGPASLFALGSALGAFLGLALGGAAAQVAGWRVAFFVAAVPGIAIAALAWRLLDEPRAKTRLPVVSETVGKGAWTAVGKLFQVRSYSLLLAAVTVLYFSQHGLSQWLPTYFARSFGMRTGEIGAAIGTIVGVGSALGSVLGGTLATVLAQRNVVWLMRLPAMCCAISVPLFIGTVSLSDRRLAYAAYAGGALMIGMLAGPIFGTIYGLSKTNERATAVAVYGLSTNILGLGLGPLFAGAMSDLLRPAVGADSLRYALLILACFMGVAATLFYWASLRVREDWPESSAPELAANLAAS
jgi:MFS family permease